LINHFEAEVGAGHLPGEYLVRVVRSAAGGEPVAKLALDVEGLLNQRRQLEETVLSSSVAARRIIPQAEQPLRQFGQQLFEALFAAGPVHGAYRASLGAVQGLGSPLRVVLRLTAPELAALPWEALFDPETETYLCRREPLVRHVPAPYTREPLEVVPPLRILGLVASPKGLPALDVEVEQHHLETALAGPIAEGLVALVWAREATWDAVHEALLAGPWHILHFVGHGDYDTHNDEGLIALVGENGRVDLVEASRLADLLDEAQPTPRLVVLNSCSSGVTGGADLFSGTAAALVHSGINAVAAMQFAISDRAAIAFAHGFYTAVAHGRGIDEAVRSGRIAILGGSRGTLEWVTPVLYLRGEATNLFTITAKSPDERVVKYAPPPEQHTHVAIEDAAYELGESAFFAGRWAEAVAHFSAVQERYPEDSKVAQRLRQARIRQDLAAWYKQGCVAGERGEWDQAVSAFERISAVDSSYQDITERLDRARWEQRRNGLIEDVRRLHAAQQWHAVIAAGQQLAALDPDTADPDGLVTNAHRALVKEEQQRTRGHSITPPNNGQPQSWSTAKRVAVAIAVLVCIASIATGITWIAHETHHVGAPSHYVPMTPKRIVDTRSGLGAERKRVDVNKTLRLSMDTAKARLPHNVSAVALDLGVVDPRPDGEIRVYPSGGAIPPVPNVVFTARQNIAGAAIVAIGKDHQVNLAVTTTSIDAKGDLDITIDLLGYFTDGAQPEPGRFQPITPTVITTMPLPFRVFRDPSDHPAALQISGRNGVPSDGIAAIVLTVSTTGSHAAGWIQAVSPSWTEDVTVLNFALNESIANQVVMPVDGKGGVNLVARTGGQQAEGQVTDTASVSGYFTAGTPDSAGGFRAVVPTNLITTPGKQPPVTPTSGCNCRSPASFHRASRSFRLTVPLQRSCSLPSLSPTPKGWLP
jgi:tetratricopeptide (TPR) repeat protein